MAVQNLEYRSGAALPCAKSDRVDAGNAHFRRLCSTDFPYQFRPEPTLRAHLLFALKYEVMHFVFLSRLFHVMVPAELEHWIRESPTGQARDAADQIAFRAALQEVCWGASAGFNHGLSAHD